MPVVVGIRFKDSGKIYFFDPQALELRPGEHVIVETVRGLELARVAYERREVPEGEIVGDLKPVVRRAEASDLERLRLLQSRHDEVLARCGEKVREHGLPMNLVKAEYSFDGSRLTFYFTAEKRVDFRMLVRDLARTFKSRIELRQIGPRDEAKLLGGIGPCGRVLCCASFLPDYARVSIKMAKDQDLPLNPTKISGVCGRLLCCLSYEHEQYVSMRAELPRKGTWVQTPDGPGEVVAQNVLRQQVLVQLASSGMQETYDLGVIEVATAQVAALARQRNAEGVTPAAQRPPRPERDRGERRMLRDEIDQYELAEELGSLEEEGDVRPPAGQQPGPAARPGPPGPPRRPDAQQQGQQRRHERGPRPPRSPQQAAPQQPPAASEADAQPLQPPVEETPQQIAARRRRRRGGRGGGGPAPKE
ncbi:MAG TPA: stage 0 sporulation family protein [Chloroflexaceae bacterium]|nr:stage 0 sporulation family protein [Chloroflexaceae bacterium]